MYIRACIIRLVTWWCEHLSSLFTSGTWVFILGHMKFKLVLLLIDETNFLCLYLNIFSISLGTLLLTIFKWCQILPISQNWKKCKLNCEFGKLLSCGYSYLGELNFCGLNRWGNFEGLYFCGILCGQVLSFGRCCLIPVSSLNQAVLYHEKLIPKFVLDILFTF